MATLLLQQDDIFHVYVEELPFDKDGYSAANLRRDFRELIRNEKFERAKVLTQVKTLLTPSS